MIAATCTSCGERKELVPPGQLEPKYPAPFKLYHFHVNEWWGHLDGWVLEDANGVHLMIGDNWGTTFTR